MNKIDSYINKLPQWQQDICTELRTLIHEAAPEIEEDWKWNSPAFSHNGLVCWFWAFKKWVSITFPYGSEIKDPKGYFNFGHHNKFNRSVKFTNVNELNREILMDFVKQAVNRNKSA